MTEHRNLNGDVQFSIKRQCAEGSL